MASLGSVIALVIPLSDMELKPFNKYVFTRSNPGEAIVAFEIAVPEGPDLRVCF